MKVSVPSEPLQEPSANSKRPNARLGGVTPEPGRLGLTSEAEAGMSRVRELIGVAGVGPGEPGHCLAGRESVSLGAGADEENGRSGGGCYGLRMTPSRLLRLIRQRTRR
jgi:hypothetical protein